MNTTVRVVGAPTDPSPWFQKWEALWSRFDPESALSQLNRSAGRWVLVPPLLQMAVARALAAARWTGGAFDPTVLPAVIAAGYGRSFEQGATELGAPVPAGRWQAVEVGPGMVRLPPGVNLDLGGIGKGLAVDLAMGRIRRRLTKGQREQPSQILVDAGGDMRLWADPESPPWIVEVEDPFGSGRLLGRVSLAQGAVATSSTLGRRWGEGLHHIIAPWTGRPSESDLVSVTVFADRAAQADVVAKACLVLGSVRALELLSRLGCRGLLVTQSAGRILSPGMEEFFCGCAE